MEVIARSFSVQGSIMSSFRFDEIGYWSEIKLEIIKQYAQAYSKILVKHRLHHVYIDGFAGPGLHITKSTGEFVPGSPLNALLVTPPFEELYLIDLNTAKANHLRKLVGDLSHVHVLEGDCNRVLLEEVFPQVKYSDYRRGLCLLDPYGLQLNWEVIAMAAEMKSLELFLNFPVADINRNVIWHNPANVDAEQANRLTAYWGDESWKTAGYSSSGDLFGHSSKTSNEIVAAAFKDRLEKVAGFKNVPDPMPMRNRRNAIVYYLFFASHNETANRIITDIFKKYRNRGAS
jgi:three-Cys-motif partner protein